MTVAEGSIGRVCLGLVRNILLTRPNVVKCPKLVAEDSDRMFYIGEMDRQQTLETIRQQQALK